MQRWYNQAIAASRELWPGKPDLRRLYLDEKLSSNVIAERLGVPRHVVQSALKSYRIPQRSLSEAAKLRDQDPVRMERRRQQLLEAQKNITPEGRRRQAVAISGPRGPRPEKLQAKYNAIWTPELREQNAAKQRGELSVHWRGGHKTRNIEGWEWRERRRECYARDGWTCQDCGVHCTKSGPTRIQAHHVVRRRDGGTNDLENLVTLCVTCHTSRERRFDGALFA